jgi:hypothetical protein
MTWIAYLLAALWDLIRGRRTDQDDEPKHRDGMTGGWGAMPERDEDDGDEPVWGD